MAKMKKSSGGSGGKLGHSNMTHWSKTHEIKKLTRRLRRAEGKRATREPVG